MREVVFDTETTGLEYKRDRIVEFGAVELVNRVETGRTFHTYINPERPVHKGALKVHGLTNDFLGDKPLFASAADELMEFIGDAPLIAHNAQFDSKFLNAELWRCQRPLIDWDRFIDTLPMARERFPGGKHTLDALAAKCKVSTAHRDRHGALVDAAILAQVYVTMLGPDTLELVGGSNGPAIEQKGVRQTLEREEAYSYTLTQEEALAHASAVDALGPGAIWNQYQKEEAADLAA